MIFINREHLCVIRTDSELESVSTEELKKPLLRAPGNLVYFETENALYGIVSTGDVYRSNGERVKINRSFTRFDKGEPMQARQFLRSHPNLGELPALENGRLAGEFQAADDELLLDRAIPFSRNACAPAFFGRLRNIALVKPAAGHGYKLPYFERMKETLDTYRAEYTIVTPEEMISRYDDFHRFLLVDLPEKKGAIFSLCLFLNIKNPEKLWTYLDIQEMLEAADSVDFEWVFQTLKSQGVETILLSAKIERETEYIAETKKAILRRFPPAENKTVNERAMPYIETFFDDLYSRDGYVESIMNERFVVDGPEYMMRLKDTSGRFLNIRDGERLTVGQPEEYDRTVYFYGPCLPIGNYVSDEYTVESFLQKRFNDAGMKIRVVNYGSWGNNVTTINRIIKTQFRKGDIIVIMPMELCGPINGLEIFDLWETLEKYQVSAEWLLDTPYHVNHHVMKLYADELFALINRKFGASCADNSPVVCPFDLVDRIFIRKFFHGVDLEKNRTAAMCVFNANPFTNGHRYLIETAAKETDCVYLIILKENPSGFSFGERFAMAVDALRDLENVTVTSGGILIGGGGDYFPEYFVKVVSPDIMERCRITIQTFAALAASLHATHVFIGEEPTDPVTMELNRTYLEIMPQYGIHPVIVPRKTQNGEIITGSLVRRLAEERSERLREYVPASTAHMMLCESINVF